MYRRLKNSCIKSYNENTKNMKTISELNEKWWYRLLKVIYFALIIFTLFIVTSFVGNETAPYSVLDLDNSNLVCLNENKSVNFKLSFNEVNRIEKSSSAYRVLEMDRDRDDLIGRLCGTKKDYLNSLPALNNTGSYVPVSNRTGVDWRKEVLERHLLIKNDKIVGSWKMTIFYIMLSWVFIFIIFEILRRIFYYIILGKIKPDS